jgi:hypothetical protein
VPPGKLQLLPCQPTWSRNTKIALIQPEAWDSSVFPYTSTFLQLLDENQRDGHMKCVWRTSPDGSKIYETGSQCTHPSINQALLGGTDNNFPRVRGREAFPY